MIRSPRREVRGPRFDGARELDAYLRELGMSVPDFCEQHALDRFHVQRLLTGQVKRCPPVDIVLALEAATQGRVAPHMWCEPSLRIDPATGTDG